MFRAHLVAGFLLVVLDVSLAVPLEQAEFSDKNIALNLDDVVIPRNSRLRSGTPLISNDWPAGIIPYVLDNAFNAKDRATLQRAFDHYRRVTCINWVPRTNQRDYVEFVKPPGGGCNSVLGRVGSRQVINLHQWCVDSYPVVLHEMMHAIGFDHEQTRPDRDNYVNIYWQNIKESDKGLFNINQRSWTYGTRYDYYSIMHYTAYAGSKNKQMTMTPKDGTDPNVLGNAKDLSATDIYRIKAMYNCDGNNDMRPRYKADPSCVDKDPNCNKLARYTYPSQCETSTSYMVHNCGRSCQVCGPKVGCYRDMPGAYFVPKPTAKHCKRYCYLKGYKYAGFKGGNSCGCSSKLGSKSWLCRNGIDVYYA